MADTVRFPLDFETSQALRSVDRVALYANKKFSNVTFKGGNAGGSIFQQLDKRAQTFGRTLDFANDRMVAFAATTSIIFGLGKAFASLTENAIKTQKALAEIQVNVKLTSTEVTTLTADLFKAANQTGQSFYAAAEAAAEFGRQGLKAAQIAEATKAALVLTQISGMDAANSVKSLTAAINTFSKEGVTYNEIVNKMAAADTSFAVSSKDLADAISRVGSTASDAGVSVNQLLAIVTSLQQSTARGGAVIGNSLKTIFTRLQRDDVASAIENIGIKTKDADGNFLNQIEVLKQLAQQYDTLNDAQKSTISEKLGGVYQINIVKGIIQDLSKSTSTYGQALKVVERAQNEAFLKSEFLGNTAINKINEAKNSFVELSEVIGKIGLNSSISTFIDNITSGVQYVSKGLNSSVDTASMGEKMGQSIIKGLINAISGPGLGSILVGFTRLAVGVMGRFSKDIGSTIIGKSAQDLRARAASIIDENRQRLVSIQHERQLNQAILQGNATLQQRLALMSRMGAGSSPGFKPPVMPRATFKNAAGGIMPAIQREAAAIGAGVGGAGRTARPVTKNIRMSPGHAPEPVVVNNHEVIIRNYKGSGADAVFNKEMIRQAGGKASLSSLGQVEHISGGFTPNFASGTSKRISGYPLGSGVDGDFFNLSKIGEKQDREGKISTFGKLLRGGIGIKRFKRGHSAELDRKIIDEYAHSKILSSHSFLPGVVGPEVFGTIQRSIEQRRVGKGVAEGNLVADSMTGLMHSKNYSTSLRVALETTLQKAGIPAGDLHYKNVMQNQAAADFFSNPRALAVLNGRSSYSNINKPNGVQKLSKIFARMQKKGGKITIVDTGHFRKPGPESPFYSEYEKIEKDATLARPGFRDPEGVQLALAADARRKRWEENNLRGFSTWKPKNTAGLSQHGENFVPNFIRKDAEGLTVHGPNFKPNFERVKQDVDRFAKFPNARLQRKESFEQNEVIFGGLDRDFFDPNRGPQGLKERAKAMFGMKFRPSPLDIQTNEDPNAWNNEAPAFRFLDDLNRKRKNNVIRKGGSRPIQPNVDIFASGYIPNMAMGDALKRQKSGNLRTWSNKRGSSIEFYPYDDRLSVAGITSLKRGDGKHLFKRLTDLARKTKRPILSSELLPQKNNDVLGMNNFDKVTSKFPQLTWRDKKNLSTTLYMSSQDSLGKNFEKRLDLESAKKYINKLPEKKIVDLLERDRIGFHSLKTTALSGGHIPNFANGLSRFEKNQKMVKQGKLIPIGSGDFGDFHKYANKEIGVKTLYDSYPDAIRKEYSSAKLLNQESLMPGVSGPKIHGSLKRAMKTGRIAKDFVSGMKPNKSYAGAAEIGMYSYLNHIGVRASDLNPTNFFVNKEADKYLSNPKIINALSPKRLYSGSTSRQREKHALKYKKRIETIFSGMAAKGGKINIFDTGAFSGVRGDSQFSEAYSKINSLANGYIPNFAGGKTPFSKMGDQELKAIINNKKYSRKARAIAKANLKENKIARAKTAFRGGFKTREQLDEMRATMPNVFKERSERDKRMAYPHLAMIGPKELTKDQREAHQRSIRDSINSKLNSEATRRTNIAQQNRNAKAYDATRTSALRSPIKSPTILSGNIPSITPSIQTRMDQTDSRNRLNNAKLGKPRIVYKDVYQANKILPHVQAQRNSIANLYRLNPAAAKENFRRTRKDRRTPFVPNGPSTFPIGGATLNGSKYSGFNRESQGFSPYTPTNKDTSRRQNSALASSAFQSEIFNNPGMSKKDIRNAAIQAGIANKGAVSDKEIKYAQKMANRSSNEKFSAKAGAFGFAATMGGSMLGDYTGSPNVGAAVGTIGMLTSMGSAAGVPGLAIGAAAGAILSFSNAMKKSVMPLEELQKNITDLSSKTEKFQGSIQSYFTSSQNLSALIKDPLASPEKIKDTARQKAISMIELPDDIRKEILSKTTETEQVDVANMFLQKQQNKTNASTALASVVSNAEKNNSGIGMVFRKLTGGKEGSVKLDMEEFNQSIDSLVANFDIEGLRAKANSADGSIQSVDAKEALKAYESGDIKGFLKNNMNLGFIPKEVIKGAYSTIDSTNEGESKYAFTRSKRKKDDAEAAATEEAKKIQLRKTSFEDFKKYEKSFNRKTALEETVSNSTRSLLGARLSIVDQQASTPENIKQTISYAQEISGLTQKKSELDRSAKDELMKIMGEAYTDSGRNNINAAGGGADFLGKYLKGNIDGTDISASIDQLVDMSTKTDSNGKLLVDVSSENVQKLNELKNEYTKQSIQIQTDRQIALEQLKALQEISKKQKFDQLIEGLKMRDPMSTAFENIDFFEIKKEVLRPSQEAVKKEEKIRVEAIRSRNSDTLIGQVQDKADKASELLDLDRKKQERGESGLSVFERSKANLIVTRGRTAEQISYETDAAKDSIKSNNLSTGLGASNALKEAKLIVAGGKGGAAGSFQNIDSAIQVLQSAVSAIGNPKNKDSEVLTNLIASITQTKNAQVGSTGVYDESKLAIKEYMKDLTVSMNDRRAANPNTDLTYETKKLGDLSEVLRQLESGDSKTASKNISAMLDPTKNTSDSYVVLKKIFDDLQTKNATIKDASFEEGIRSNSRDAEGITDWSALLGSSSQTIKSSNDILTTALNNLTTQTNLLATTMATEAQIATKSKDQADLSAILSDFETKRNEAKSRLGSGKITDAEVDNAFKVSRTREFSSFYDTLSNEISKGDKRGFEAGVSAGVLQKIAKSGQLGDIPVETFDKWRKNVVDFYPQGSPEDQKAEGFDKSYMEVLKQNTFKTPTSQQSAEVAAFEKAIAEISKLLNQSTDEIKALRNPPKKEEEKGATPATSTEVKTTAAVDVNVSGMGNELLSMFKDGFISLIQQQIELNKNYPNLAESGMA